MKKINYYFTLGFVFFITLGVNAGNLKVTGYFPSYRATTNVSAQCAMLTDIIFSFINPNSTGNLIKTNTDATFGFDENKFIIVRDAASSNGTNLWLALGGADDSGIRTARLNDINANSTYRTTLATELVTYANANGCYGVSIDHEFPVGSTNITNHLAFLQALHTAILASTNVNLKVAVAVGGEYAGVANHLGYVDNSLFSTNANLVDEWHVMAYDMPVPNGTGYDANSHSSLNDARGTMEGWNTKGVPYNKMLLGVPFYARSSSNRANTLEYNNLGGTKSTNFGQDSYGTWYYNGCPTIQSKMELAYTTKQSMGILIWDLGQDFAPSDPYSLLKCINDKKAVMCPVPKPNMGADKGFCAPNTVTLNPGVPASAGRTFAWYKNNVLQVETTTTLAVSSAGTYRVKITEGSCYAEDEIIIVAGSPFTTTGASGCNGDNLILTVNNPDGAKTYDWYDAAISGTKKGSGTTYSQVFNSNTTLYVEEKATGVNTYTGAIQTYGDVELLGGQFQAMPYNNSYRGQRITVLADLTVKYVRIYVSHAAGASGKIRVLKAVDNSLITESSTFTYATKTSTGSGYDIVDLAVNFALTTGDYFIYPECTSGTLGFGANKGQAFTQSGVFEVEKNSYVDWSPGGTATFLTSEKNDAAHVHYGSLFKIVIETGANASCGRTAATATTVSCAAPVVAITKPTSNQNFPFDGNPINLAATVTSNLGIASVSFEIWDGVTKLATIVPSQNVSTFSATWTPTTWYSSRKYTLKAIATDTKTPTAQVTNATVDFIVVSSTSTSELIPVTVSQVNLYPNPSSSNLNVNVSAAKAGAATISVYDLAGRTLFTSTQTISIGANISSVDVNSLASGSYILNVTMNGETVNKSFSVVK